MTGLEWYKGRRCAVLGASGLIGSYAVKALLEAGASVHAVLHRRDGNEWTRQCASKRLDLMVPEQAQDAAAGCEVVVNCSGITGGIGITKVDPVSYVVPATALACNVIHACHEAKARLGFLSSTTVYAPSDDPVAETDLHLSETEPPYPLYAGIGYSKRFLEKACRYYHERVGLEVAVVRPSGAYGRWDNVSGTGHVVPMLLQRALALKPGESFEVWGDGQDVRDLVHAADVARGFLLAIANKPDADPINLASGHGITTGVLARMVLEATGSTADIKFRPDKPTALKKRLVAVGKARRLLGFEARVSLEDGLRDTARWLRERG